MRSDSNKSLYRYIPIWTRHPDHLCLYRVVEIIGLGFVVQSRDFYYQESGQDHHLQLGQQFLELLSETPPEQRMPPQESIQAAIADFDRKFQDGA